MGELLTGKNQTASDRLSQSEDRRQDIETQFESTGEKIEHLERQVAAAKEIAEESDKKVEEVVRKLMLAELQRDRAESKAERNDSKIISLEKELENITKNMSSLSKSGDQFAEQEDQIADQISTLKQ